MGKDDRQGGPSAPKTGSFTRKLAKSRGVSRKSRGGEEAQKPPGATKSGVALSFELHGKESGGQTPESSED